MQQFFEIFKCYLMTIQISFSLHVVRLQILYCKLSIGDLKFYSVTMAVSCCTFFCGNEIKRKQFSVCLTWKSTVLKFWVTTRILCFSIPFTCYSFFKSYIRVFCFHHEAFLYIIKVFRIKRVQDEELMLVVTFTCLLNHMIFKCAKNVI